MACKIALAGNPNCGKTTLFNALTGSNQFVGNWPGVTVEKKEGKLKGYNDVIVVDLPGIYSLSPYTQEEVVARNFLVNEKPDVILNIVDGTNLERNLYLTTQLAELGIPIVIAINMMDIVKKNGDKIHSEILSKKLGCPVYEISAIKSECISEAAEEAIKVAAKKEKMIHKHRFDGSIEHTLAHIEEAVLHDMTDALQRWYAVKLFERDSKVTELLFKEGLLTEDKATHIEKDIVECETELDDDSESIITAARYQYIDSIIEQCYTRSKTRGLSTSDKIDKIVTNRWLALPLFAAIMFLVYFVSVTTVGAFVTDWTNDALFGEGYFLFGNGRAQYEEALVDYAETEIWTPQVLDTLEEANAANVLGAEEIFNAIQAKDFAAFEESYLTFGSELDVNGFSITEAVDLSLADIPSPSSIYGLWIPGIPILVEGLLNAVNCATWLQSLIIDGIIGGVGAVLGFVPQMLVLFLFLAWLEACGYMARIAFIMDRIFRKFGLSGKSFIPMLIGTGCGVPGIMASRTIENLRDRRMTIITTTFIPCGAKLPIIALVSAALFGGAAWVAPLAYFIGVAAVICSGIILKKTKLFAGDPAPFVMELPAYHLPTFVNVMRSMWERGWSFIKKAGTVILLASIIIWAGSVFGWINGHFGFSLDMELNDSILGAIGNSIKWIFAPLGFGDSTATVATIMGLLAKEEVVGVFGVLNFQGLGSALAGFSFLIFNLLCAPCFAAMGAIRREMNSARWTVFAIAYQCVFAWFVSFCVYQIGMMFSGTFSIGFVIAIIFIMIFAYLLFRPSAKVKVKR